MRRSSCSGGSLIRRTRDGCRPALSSETWRLKKFYKFMEKRGVVSPFVEIVAPRARRQEDVKWLDPDGYKRWRDLGVRGLDLSGRHDRWWRGRNGDRDAAFCDGLYGTGLRVPEWASVVLPELPAYDRRRGFYTCQLADRCAKGGAGHPYWIPRLEMKGCCPTSRGRGRRRCAGRRLQGVTSSWKGCG
jgi:hypothetical protein